MNAALKTLLSMSVSGSLLILVLLAGKRFLKDKVSRQWQYYIWLVVVLRLLVPFGPEATLLGKAYQDMDRVIAQAAAPDTAYSSDAGREPENQEPGPPAVTAHHPSRDVLPLLADHLWLVWLAAALGMLIRKITVYQSFVRYVNSCSTPVADAELLDRLSIAAEQMGIRKPVELSVAPLVSSPLLTGFFRPCIVLPGTDISEKDFRYIILHELTHCKRRDTVYKWLVQVTVCLHWFNPLVHLMGREIARACEFSCDEAVLAKTGYGNAQEYGSTLLDAMAAVGRYKEPAGAVTLSENKQLLKERIIAIMNVKKKSTAVRIMTGALTVCMVLGAAYVGVYPAAAADVRRPAEQPQVQKSETSSAAAEKYYEAGSLPLFEIAFSRLEEAEQRTWLNRIYEDGEIAFFSVSTDQLKAGSSLIDEFAEKLYADGSIAFFSVLADRMDEDTLEDWLDRALDDKRTSFQAMLFGKLDMDDELDELEKELDARQLEEYRAHGVARDGKNYWYKGELVNIFLDIRKDSSFYTLDYNTEGTVNIKITRNADGEIETVSYMTEAEAEELLADMADDDE